MRLTESDCRHIKAAVLEHNKVYKDLGTASETSEALVAHIAARNMLIDDTKSVSHLLIPPPEWCGSPRDEMFPTTYFEGGRRLPPRFNLDVNLQCSCGETVISENDGMYDTLLIYTSFMVLKAEIQTSHCKSCANTSGRIGPDLCEHGLFNYNNTIVFSHELMNSYTSQFTNSETLFNAFYNTILHSYKNESFVAPFCAEQTFKTAWYAFIKLQHTNSDMQCSQCGPNPEIVIADGVSISFAKRQLGNLRPRTVSDQTTALVKLPRTSTRASCFIRPTRLITAIQKALDEPDLSLGKGKLPQILAKEVQDP
jgi:CxC4 like cysteine cluster associated with KDZ transposases